MLDAEEEMLGAGGISHPRPAKACCGLMSAALQLGFRKDPIVEDGLHCNLQCRQEDSI